MSENKGDLISRKDLRKQINNCEYFHSSFQKMTVAEFLTIVFDLIDNAPTVDVKAEKIIRCIDCKYYHPFKHLCDCHEDWSGGEDGFCSLAKMKDGEEE